MSMASYEKTLWRELQEQTGNKKIRLKDFMEWGSTPCAPQEGEKAVRLEKSGMYVAYKEPA